jgi:hypothetical protein
MSQSRQIQLPADLCAAAEAKYRGSFRTVEQLVVFLLQELLRTDTTAMDLAEQQAVEQRLKDLGYI